MTYIHTQHTHTGARADEGPINRSARNTFLLLEDPFCVLFVRFFLLLRLSDGISIKPLFGCWLAGRLHQLKASTTMDLTSVFHFSLFLYDVWP